MHPRIKLVLRHSSFDYRFQCLATMCGWRFLTNDNMLVPLLYTCKQIREVELAGLLFHFRSSRFF